MEDRREAVVLVVERDAEKADVRNAGDAGVAVGEVDPVDEDETDDLAEGERHDGEIVAAQPQHGEAENDPPHRRERARQGQADRKSTRLNSSHVRISYAVFCLKKK